MILKRPRLSGTAWWAIIVILSLVIWGASLAAASKKMRPLTPEEVSQVWVGLSEDELYIFRLSLASDGGGFGAYAFQDDEPRIFHISDWKYDPPSVSITIKSVDQSPLVATYMSGEIVGVRMRLRISGKGWSRSLSLRREKVLISRWSKVKEAMSKSTPATPHP